MEISFNREGDCVPRRSSDLLGEFSHRITQLEFIILKIVIFIGFVLWVWGKAKHDFQNNFEPPPNRIEQLEPDSQPSPPKRTYTILYRESVRYRANLRSSGKQAVRGTPNGDWSTSIANRGQHRKSIRLYEPSSFPSLKRPQKRVCGSDQHSGVRGTDLFAGLRLGLINQSTEIASRRGKVADLDCSDSVLQLGNETGLRPFG